MTRREDAHETLGPASRLQPGAVSDHRETPLPRFSDQVSIVGPVRRTIGPRRQPRDALAESRFRGDHRPAAPAEQHLDRGLSKELVGDLRLGDIPRLRVDGEGRRRRVRQPHVGHEAGGKAPLLGPLQNGGDWLAAFRVHAERLGEHAPPGRHLGGGGSGIGGDPRVGERNRIARAPGLGQLGHSERPAPHLGGVGHPQRQLVHPEPVADEHDHVLRPRALRRRTARTGEPKREERQRKDRGDGPPPVYWGLVRAA